MVGKNYKAREDVSTMYEERGKEEKREKLSR